MLNLYNNKKIVTLIGRPNVGKSTLFNRLSIDKKSIVYNKPGVTRDIKYSNATLGGEEFIAVDTPGLLLDTKQSDELSKKMIANTINTIKKSDLVCLIVDFKSGILPEDKIYANILHKINKNTILIINKCEKKFDFSKEYYDLGFSEIAPISAAHGTGFIELYDSLLIKFQSQKVEKSDSNNTSKTKIKLAIVGRPNVGKSTFINSILNEDRLLTGKISGVTRESIENNFVYKNYSLLITDTPGLRKKTLVVDELEKLSCISTMNSINYSNIVILMIDGQKFIEQQDLKIANYAIKQGRGIVIAVNKCDLISAKEYPLYKEKLLHTIEKSLSQIQGVYIVFISSLTKENIFFLLDSVLKVHEIWSCKIVTSKLNQWLRFITEKHPLNLTFNKKIRFKYITQIKSRPPTFKIFSNYPKEIPDSYNKYLLNKLRETFHLPGMPIRIKYSESKNPYS